MLPTQDEAQGGTGRLVSIGLVSASTVVSAGLGLTIQLLIVRYYGATQFTDAYFMSRGIANLITGLTFAMTLSGVFVPIFAEVRIAQPARAWGLFWTLTGLCFVGGVVLLIVTRLMGVTLVTLFAPGFTATQKAFTANLLVVFLLIVPMTAVTSLLVAVFQFLGRYWISEAFSLIHQIVVVTLFVSTIVRIDLSAVALAYLVGNALELLAYIVALIVVEPRCLQVTVQGIGSTLRLLWQRLYPFALGDGASYFQSYVYRLVASTLPVGVFSLLSYAQQFQAVIKETTFSPIAITAFPLFSRRVASRQDQELQREFQSTTGDTTVWVMPGLIYLFLAGQEIVYVIFGWLGRLDASSLATLAVIFRFFLLTMLPAGYYVVLRKLMLALSKTRSLNRVLVIARIGQSVLLVFTPFVGYLAILVSHLVSNIYQTYACYRLLKSRGHIVRIFTRQEFTVGLLGPTVLLGSLWLALTLLRWTTTGVFWAAASVAMVFYYALLLWRYGLLRHRP